MEDFLQSKTFNSYIIRLTSDRKVMLFKIGLIAILLPLHHWMEDKAIHYLTSQHLLRIKGKGVVGKLFRKKDADLPMGNL